MARANKRDYGGAIADYSAAIWEPSIPTDVKAMALYNRALAYSTMQDGRKGGQESCGGAGDAGIAHKHREGGPERWSGIRRRAKTRKPKIGGYSEGPPVLFCRGNNAAVALLPSSLMPHRASDALRSGKQSLAFSPLRRTMTALEESRVLDRETFQQSCRTTR